VPRTGLPAFRVARQLSRRSTSADTRYRARRGKPYADSFGDAVLRGLREAALRDRATAAAYVQRAMSREGMAGATTEASARRRGVSRVRRATRRTPRRRPLLQRGVSCAQVASASEGTAAPLTRTEQALRAPLGPFAKTMRARVLSSSLARIVSAIGDSGHEKAVFLIWPRTSTSRSAKIFSGRGSRWSHRQRRCAREPDGSDVVSNVGALP